MSDPDDRTPALIVSGTIEIDPAQVETAKGVVGPLMAATRAEPGCIAYGFYADLDDPGAFHLYEEWESEAANEAHVATEHFATFLAAMADLDVRRVALRRHDVSATRRI